MSKLLFAIYIKKGTKDIKYHAACNVYVLVNQVNQSLFPQSVINNVCCKNIEINLNFAND